MEYLKQRTAWRRSMAPAIGAVILASVAACSAEPSRGGPPMIATAEPVLSATVWVRSASGLEPRPEVAITAENVADFDADAKELVRAAESFRSLGFKVEAAQGPMFAITAQRALFEAVFKTSLAVTDDDGLADKKARDEGLELPLSELPEEVRSLLWRVLFSPRPILLDESDDSPSFDF